MFWLSFNSIVYMGNTASKTRDGLVLRRTMASKNISHRNNHPCASLRFKQNLQMYLVTKSSNCFWFFIDYFSCKLDGFARLYEQLIQKEYTKESARITLSPGSKVLHIGCGAYPLTAVTIAQMFDVKHVVGIDRSEEAVHFAKNVVHRKQLDHRITIERGDGRTYPVESFDVIIVSSCSWPTIDVLEHLIHTAKKRSRIIIRELDQVVDPIVQRISAHDEIVLTERMYHHPFPFVEPFGWQTFYLRKK